MAWRLNEEQALKDSLTRLPNRRLFCDRVEHSLAREARRAGTIGVLFIDLDRFKDVNDTLGHPAGDQLLVSVAERLRVVLRPGRHRRPLRRRRVRRSWWKTSPPATLTEVAERVLGRCPTPFVVKAKEVAVGASVGVAVSAPGDTVDDLLRNADVAMYTAKHAGRGRYAFFQPDMDAEVIRRVEVEKALRRAVDDGEFVLHYQPIYALASGRLVGPRGAAALAASDPGAARPGRVPRLGRRHRSHRRDRNLGPPRSLPADAQLDRPAPRARPWPVGEPVAHPARPGGHRRRRRRRPRLLRAARPNDLTLEITEDVMVKGSAAVLGRLHALKALGVTWPWTISGRATRRSPTSDACPSTFSRSTRPSSTT